MRDCIIRDCPDCKKGKHYVDFDEFDKFMLICTNCKFSDKIVRDAIMIKVHLDTLCNKCSQGNVVTVEVENPFLSGETSYTGCIFCDVNLK